ncbi:hypothetical protein [Aulosira sp. FACHB-615]|uniref:hypothetical protein n=1 Tax=Aulosira sp. FACHB-615 TaxID=2692777 RepID=UPI00168914A7|nr:hypothetical protein [Aulosira sp. FACHB-615]MBD2491234.1 hypothetical protein [Aulosira sp. FACHB-615]
MLLIINLVFISFFVMMFCLLLSYKQTQEALIWWNNKQCMRMYQEAEAIQNGLLQESFVIRRNLELSLVNPALSQQQQEQYYLATIEKFHHSLKQLNSYLSPAYIGDTLPLAIKYMLLGWESHIPELSLQIDLQNDWYQESFSTSRVILMILDELLQTIKLNVTMPLSIFISLKQRGKYSELILQLSYLAASQQIHVSILPNPIYLCHVFNLLAKGKSRYQYSNSTERWKFLWKPSQTSIAK